MCVKCRPRLACAGKSGTTLSAFVISSFKESLFLAKLQFRRKVSSLISLFGLRTCIKPPFHRARLICTWTSARCMELWTKTGQPFQQLRNHATVNQVCRVLRKLGIMLVRKVSSQISLCSPHRLIRVDTFRLNLIFAKMRHYLNEKFHKSGNCRPWLACADCTG